MIQTRKDSLRQQVVRIVGRLGICTASQVVRELGDALPPEMARRYGELRLARERRRKGEGVGRRKEIDLEAWGRMDCVVHVLGRLYRGGWIGRASPGVFGPVLPREPKRSVVKHSLTQEVVRIVRRLGACTTSQVLAEARTLIPSSWAAAKGRRLEMTYRRRYQRKYSFHKPERQRSPADLVRIGRREIVNSALQNAVRGRFLRRVAPGVYAPPTGGKEAAHSNGQPNH